MPQLRKDPVVGRWVIISTERAKRPGHYEHPKNPPKSGPCPFCEGNEGLTPPEIMAYRPGGSHRESPGWTLRVVPNKFPALMIEGDLDRRGDGVYDLMNGVGAHEVVIETPSHETNMGVLSEKQFEEILWAYRDRVLDLRKDKRFRYVLIFKNQGAAAGATLEHTHSQLIALPIVPRSVTDELVAAQEYYKYKERCIYCDVLRQELEERARVVSENESFAVICPFAPRFPFETWILPKKHSSYFEHASKQEYLDLSRSLRETLVRLNRALNDPPFNYIIHSMPFGEAENGHYHWHLEVMPKLTQVAGFEWGTGFYINPVTPEESTSCLRGIAL
ncbi:MAG: galactose-1-phosphate uridylyltransferase [Deltaproteobacteria bacterium]|nr:galactose-1-phosphate uridylyltransferase [Deltaproteobacteria bacterium]